ncbi:MAG: SufE family protein [Bacteroidetes bacterium]|nr:SufE family protein [Bacteroidota bacterium]
MTIIEAEKKVLDDFEIFDGDWEMIYQQIIDEGKKLPSLPDSYKNELYKIKGCQSSVWLNSECKNGIMEYNADSDSVFVKGLISLLVRILNNQKPADIVNADLGFIDKMGLRHHLAQTRSTGLSAMIARMKAEALQYR